VAAERFSAAVLAHLREPRLGGRWPPQTPGVCSGESGAEDQGIWIRLQLRTDAARRVEEARFQAFGCPVAIACASWLAEWAQGKPLAALGSASGPQLCAALELTPDQQPTAELALAALRDALYVGGR
jgi:NifU-like protein involved in Fe-S cluster formation